MKRLTPLLTLLTGLVVGAVLLVLSTNATPPTAAADGTAVAATSPAQRADPVPAPPVTAETEPTAEPTEPQEAAPAPPKKATANWAGRVDGGKATIAITAKDGKAIAYLCDGNRVESWLQGTAENGELTLTGKGAAELTGTFGNGKATGDVVVGGKRWSFTVATVAKPSGLYRATADVRNARVVGGWIVLADGTQVGVVTVDGVPRPAGPLDLRDEGGTTVVDGTTVTAVPATTGGGPGE